MGTEAITQTKAILAHLKSGKTLTPLQALNKFGCLRLAARILDIRNSGLTVNTHWEAHGRHRWARYRMPVRSV